MHTGPDMLPDAVVCDTFSTANALFDLFQVYYLAGTETMHAQNVTAGDTNAFFFMV